MARVAVAVLALALIAAVPAAHAVTLVTNTMSSPYVGFTGPLGGGMKLATGTLSILDDHTMEIKGFTYNNSAPNTHFWGAKSASAADLKAGMELNPVKLTRAYFNEDLIVPIYSNITWSEINVVSVWCEMFYVDFGHAAISPAMMAPAMAPMAGMPTTGGRKMM